MAIAVAAALPATAMAGGPDNDGVGARERISDASLSASAKGVRAYALVNRKGSFEFKKGFKSVRNPSDGVFCLTPSVNLDLKKIAPSVTVEWGLSFGNNLSAFYHQLQTEGCKKSEIEVLTFSFKAGENNKLSNDASFVISVP